MDRLTKAQQELDLIVAERQKDFLKIKEEISKEQRKIDAKSVEETPGIRENIIDRIKQQVKYLIDSKEKYQEYDLIMARSGLDSMNFDIKYEAMSITDLITTMMNLETKIHNIYSQMSQMLFRDYCVTIDGPDIK